MKQSNFSFHVELWITYTVLFVFLTLLIPCLWVSYIWDQIIDPHYESDNIAVPDHRLLKVFYFASRKITSNFWWRTPIFFIIAALFVTASVLDVVFVPPPSRHNHSCLISFFFYLGPHTVLTRISKGKSHSSCCSLRSFDSYTIYRIILIVAHWPWSSSSSIYGKLWSDPDFIIVSCLLAVFSCFFFPNESFFELNSDFHVSVEVIMHRSFAIWSSTS